MDRLTVDELVVLVGKYKNRVEDGYDCLIDEIKDMLIVKQNRTTNYIIKWICKKLQIKAFDVYSGPGLMSFKFKEDNILFMFRMHDMYDGIYEMNSHGNIIMNNTIISYKLTRICKHYSTQESKEKLVSQLHKIKNLCNSTNYLDNLPLCYTFILSSPSLLRYRDITKLIAHKILFFTFLHTSKSKRKKTEEVGAQIIRGVRRKKMKKKNEKRMNEVIRDADA